MIRLRFCHLLTLSLLVGGAGTLNACNGAPPREVELEGAAGEGVASAGAEAATGARTGDDSSSLEDALSRGGRGGMGGAEAADAEDSLSVAPAPAPIGGVEYIIAVSVDGLGSFYLKDWIDKELPTFQRLKKEAAYTLNARADVTYTFTLPNHSSMLTGLPVSITDGLSSEQAHGYTSNSTPGLSVTLHNSGNTNRDYIPSVFDVVHDQGFKTAMYSTKPKFVLFEQTYNMAGAKDLIREDNGREKIDTVVIELDHDLMMDALLEELTEAPAHFTFLHLAAPDQAGHSYGWGGDEYLLALQKVDALLKRLLDTVRDDALLAGRSAVLLTSDHGGQDYGHSSAGLPEIFTIPFFIWGPEQVAGGNLYELAGESRLEPVSEENPSYNQSPAAIRNADLGNISLEMLGLPLIEGSVTRRLGL